MKRMKFEADYAYKETFIPPRCRKPRTREAHGTCTVSIPSITAEEAPVALRHRHCWFPEIREYRWYNEKLYCRAPYSSYLSGAKGWFPLDELKNHFRQNYFSPWEVKDGKQAAIRTCKEKASRYLIISDGEVWELAGEPRYEIATFGLGHNHASTALMIANEYNGNVRGDYYFSALEREKAVERCVEVAMARGDTNSVEDIRSSWAIEVLIPEAVRCKPAKEAGPGDPFLNMLGELVDSSTSPTEAALLAMVVSTKN